MNNVSEKRKEEKEEVQFAEWHKKNDEEMAAGLIPTSAKDHSLYEWFPNYVKRTTLLCRYMGMDAKEIKVGIERVIDSDFVRNDMLATSVIQTILDDPYDELEVEVDMKDVNSDG